MKIICVEFENLKQFANGKFRVDFVATDRVLKKSELFKISSTVATQNIIGFVGLNATGKTTALRLLKTALGIVIRNEDLNSAITSSLIVDGTIIRTTFFHNGVYYQLESVVGCRNDKNEDGRQKFYYSDEKLKTKKSAKIYSRSELTDFTDGKNVEVKSRSSIEEENEATYLEETKSIVRPVIKSNNSHVSGDFWRSFINSAVPSGMTPPEVLEAFDDSIEEFSVYNSLSKDKPNWVLRFKNDNLVYRGDNMLEPNLLISTGTISGQNLILEAIIALKKGGYLLVDELEAHLNKELVRAVLNLFASQETNPKGACLIFSTHYVEILDFGILNRKDNIYITRKRNYLLSAMKFSDEFKCNDVKKKRDNLVECFNWHRSEIRGD